jgi:Oxidoreductase family, NAD-binding Rossmann fold
MVEPRILRCGIVGARRARNGTGPFLAGFLEAAHCVVVGVAGRNAESAGRAAQELAARLGHPVVGHGSVGELLGSGLDALVIASPDEAHLPALRAALDTETAVLCEKPLVPAEEIAVVAPLVEGFRRSGVLLMEGCQWPMALSAMDELHPGREREPSRFAMRLSPAEPGPSTLRGSLSHFLSVVQAEWPVTAETSVEDLSFAGTGGEDGLVTSFRLRNRPSDGCGAECRLELIVCPDQPRPAWLEIDDLRMERVVDMATYSISFVSADRTSPADDPTKSLVYRFAELVRTGNRERNRTESDRVEQRARLYSHVVHRFVEHLAE